MARDPHDTVDFAPAWLNFNNSNKKKADKNVHSSQSSVTFNPPLKSSQDPVFRTSSLGGGRVVGSPSRSTGNASRWVHQSPVARSSVRHQSVEFSHCEEKDLFPLSPSKDLKNVWSRSGTFSPTFKRETGFQAKPNKNGQVRLRHSNATGDGSLGMDTDFPSLSDIDISDQNKTKQHPSNGPTSSSNVVNMWEKPLVLKRTGPDSSQNVNSTASTKTQLTSSIYKTLVPKPAPHPKQPYRRALSVPLSLPSKGGNSVGDLITSGSKREHSAIGRQSQVTNPSKAAPENTTPSRPPRTDLRTTGSPLSVDIGVVSALKKHRKGKSHFLKTLRQTEGGCDSAGGVHPKDEGSIPAPSETQIIEESEDQVKKDEVDAFDDSNQDASSMEHPSIMRDSRSWNDPINRLSSSLEAEHRLLREMGWHDEQAMEDEPPLTEDEIREFFLQNKSNGLLSIPPSGQRETAFRNALSGWKFPGIRKPSSDGDNEKPRVNGRISHSSDDRCHQDESSDSLSSDDEL